MQKTIKTNYNNYTVPGNLPLVNDAVMYDTQIRLIVYGIEAESLNSLPVNWMNSLTISGMGFFWTKACASVNVGEGLW